MAATRNLPPMNDLVKMVEAGMTHQQIADKLTAELGIPVARSTVSVALSRAGKTDTASRYKDTLPWRVKVGHLKAYPARMLRLLGRRINGLDLTDEDAGRLDRWLHQLEEDNAVVAYDPNSPEGFWYVDRAKGDGRQIPIRTQTIDITALR